jgi:hypothetical protein
MPDASFKRPFHMMTSLSLAFWQRRSGGRKKTPRSSGIARRGAGRTSAFVCLYINYDAVRVLRSLEGVRASNFRIPLPRVTQGLPQDARSRSASFARPSEPRDRAGAAAGRRIGRARHARRLCAHLRARRRGRGRWTCLSRRRARGGVRRGRARPLSDLAVTRVVATDLVAGWSCRSFPWCRLAETREHVCSPGRDGQTSGEAVLYYSYMTR